MVRAHSIAQLGSVPMLEVLSEKGKGEVYELTGDRITIGRSENNDIIIQGEAVSRYHASIERNENEGFVVRDQQSKNGVQVNGVTVSESSLRSGDILQIGTFVFRFTAPVGAELAEADEENENSQIYSNVPSETSRPKVNKRVLIYGAVGLLLAVLYLYSVEEPKKSGGEKNTAVPGLPELPPLPVTPVGEAKTESVVGAEDPLLSGSVSPETKRTADAKEAEQYFKKGLREYTNENYHRAIEMFSLALALNRRHEGADYYLKLAIFQLESDANKNFEIGRKYFETLQYQRAIYHFSEVIRLLEHKPNDKRIKDAGQFIDKANQRLLEATQFR